MKEFNQLPNNIQNEIKEHLKAYDKCHVVYEYGEYHVGGGLCIKKHYGEDHEYIGCFKADELFTEEERMINYIESFHSYPFNYTGKQDWKMLNSIKGKWDVKFKMENGNLVIA